MALCLPLATRASPLAAAPARLRQVPTALPRCLVAASSRRGGMMRSCSLGHQRWRRLPATASSGNDGAAPEGGSEHAAAPAAESSKPAAEEQASHIAGNDSNEPAAAASSAATEPAVSSSSSSSSSSEQGSSTQQPQPGPNAVAAEQQQPPSTAAEGPPAAAATAAATAAGGSGGGSSTAASPADPSQPTRPWLTGEASLAPPDVAAALGAFFRVLADVLRLLFRLALVEPLSWVLNKMGLQAVLVQRELERLERIHQHAALDPDLLAHTLRVLNRQGDHAAVVQVVESRCLSLAASSSSGGSSGSGNGSSEAAAPPPRYPVNSAVVREYLSALVHTGRLSQFGDNPALAPDEGRSHRSLPQLLEELRAAAAGERAPEAPGATVARPLHVIVQTHDKGGGALSWIASFLWSCIAMTAVLAVMTAGAATMRRLQGGAPPLPSGGASVAAAAGSSQGMFGHKEYSKENLPEKSVKKFADVKGCDEAIAELQEIVEYLKNPDKFTRLGGKLPKGVLLTGPPGTGKTLLARAVAGEAGVPFFYKAGSEFDEMFVGVGSRRVRSLFSAAKKKAPCIIFIDEIDAMGGKRTNWEASGGSRKTLNQLLTDMDGFEENSGVVVMAATNLPELLDTALTRPGRFDRQVAVTLPDVHGRQEILGLYLKGKPVAADVDTELLARRTPGFSGAELANLVNEAALLAARQDRDAISTQLLDEARDKVLMGTPRVITQSEEARRLTAYHEGGHALVALYTPGAKPIHKATIVPRGHALGMVSQLPEKDEYSVTRQQMQAQIDVCMGGKAAEELIFGEDHVTSGATSDLRQATRMARHMVVDCGMSERIGPVAVGEEQSPSTRQAVDDEVQGMLKAAYSRVTSLLREREAELHALAQALLRSETLTQAEIKELLARLNSPEAGGSAGSGGQLVEGGVGELAAPAPAAAAAVAAAALAPDAPPA